MKFIEYDTSFSEEEKKQAKVLKITCNLNNAACKLKLKDYKQAEKLCTKVMICNHVFFFSTESFIRFLKFLRVSWNVPHFFWQRMNTKSICNLSFNKPNQGCRWIVDILFFSLSHHQWYSEEWPNRNIGYQDLCSWPPMLLKVSEALGWEVSRLGCLDNLPAEVFLLRPMVLLLAPRQEEPLNLQCVRRRSHLLNLNPDYVSLFLLIFRLRAPKQSRKTVDSFGREKKLKIENQIGRREVVRGVITANSWLTVFFSLTFLSLSEHSKATVSTEESM